MPIIDYLNNNHSVVSIAFLVMLVVQIIVFYVGGRKAERSFANLRNRKIQFRERYASGNSNKNFITKGGGASKVLDVVVTDGELWIKGIWPMFTFIGGFYDLAHRVPLGHISKVSSSNKTVDIWFKNKSETESHIKLWLNDVDGFVLATSK